MQQQSRPATNDHSTVFRFEKTVENLFLVFISGKDFLQRAQLFSKSPKAFAQKKKFQKFQVETGTAIVTNDSTVLKGEGGGGGELNLTC